MKPERAPVPLAVVTLMSPDAPVPTVAFICVLETMVKELAGVPPKLTAVAPVKFVPNIEITVPVPPFAGEKEVIAGGGRKVNPANKAVPYGVVTKTFPEAPAPTTAVIVASFTTVKDVAATPPNVTAVAPVKYVPLMVTVVPWLALCGANDVITGVGNVNVKPDLVEVPDGDETIISPEAPVPTTAVIVVALTTVNELAAVPPNVTAVVPLKLTPEMVTVSPGMAVVGVNEVICGSVVLFLKRPTLNTPQPMPRSVLPSPFQSAATIPLLHKEG